MSWSTSSARAVASCSAISPAADFARPTSTGNITVTLKEGLYACREFLIGLISLDLTTAHGGVLGESLSRVVTLLR